MTFMTRARTLRLPALRVGAIATRATAARARFDALVPARVRGVASWVAIALVGLLVVGLVFAAIAPRVLGINFIIVAGGSMEPTIPFGSLAVMRDADPASLGVGDVIAYPSPRNNDVMVTHRITGISDTGEFITRGDANSRDDSDTVPPDTVQHEYLFAIPSIGSAVHWLGTPAGFFAVVLVPGILVIVGEVRSIVASIRNRGAASG